MYSIRGHSCLLDADGYAVSLSFNHCSLSNETLKSESSDGKYIESSKVFFREKLDLNALTIQNWWKHLNGFEKNLLTTNATVLLLIPSLKVTISRLNRIGRQLHPVKLADKFRISDIRLYILDVHIIIYPLSQRVYAQNFQKDIILK